MDPSKNHIPGMEPNKNYSSSNNNANSSVQNQEKTENQQKKQPSKEEMEKIKKDLEKIKTFLNKKYKYIQGIGILPQQSIPQFIEEEEAPKESENHTHLLVLIPEDKKKNLEKIKNETLEELKKTEHDVWLHVKPVTEIWEYCLDSKFELFSAIAMAYPLYDKGIFGALRVSEIHKSLVLQKFEKYIVSYVLGGSLIRGDAIKTSDVDVFIIINDTDVKRMPRVELKERLRSIIYQYVSEAASMAGVQNKLEPQIYLLTDFWEAVKDAHPVIFTFIRDGVPIYDRGTFMPWKSLLKMGKLKPSPEAIDMFMSMGDNTRKRAERALLDIVIQDIYWGVITPSQALLMLYGSPPPTPKQVVPDMKKIFHEKEKMLEKKYIDILEEIVVKYYKGFEHGKVKKVSGKEVDKLLDDMEIYTKRLKELRGQIEKRAQEKTIEQLYNDIMDLLKPITGMKSQNSVLEHFEKDFVKKGKFSNQHLRTLKDIIKARDEFKKGKTSSHKIEQARRKGGTLVNDLIEYSQRCELASLEKGKINLKYKGKNKESKTQEKIASLINCEDASYLFKEDKILKLTNKVQETNLEEANKAIEKQKKSSKEVKIKPEIFDLLKKELGDYEIIFE
ncbi:MAG TPA: nucleotidyltransferase domain-containing protein [Candidatus Nanoarchaeia archaeon]|nr:nucleotidyltransferase domain-containing protein [Candidatus Nanoarchaeia archaeon]